jgi:ketosteroid isomerase-like protein
MLRNALAAMAFILPLSLLTSPAVAADDDAKAIAEKFLAAGAKLFDAKDAAGLAATYTDDAVATTISREDKNTTGKLKVEVTRGRADIEKGYRDVFKPDSVFHSKNTVKQAHMIGSDVLIVAGEFDLDSQSSDSIKVPFIQVRTKEGDAWKLVSLELFILLDK